MKKKGPCRFPVGNSFPAEDLFVDVIKFVLWGIGSNWMAAFKLNLETGASVEEEKALCSMIRHAVWSSQPHHIDVCMVIMSILVRIISCPFLSFTPNEGGICRPQCEPWKLKIVYPLWQKPRVVSVILFKMHDKLSMLCVHVHVPQLSTVCAQNPS